MRVFCPTCSEAITISDELAGQATFCPLCKSAFTAPTLFPVPPAAPPMPVPAAVAPSITVTSDAPGKDATMSAPATIPFPTPAPSPGTPPGYSRSVGFALLPEIVQWIAPAALVLSVILTFFAWNGAYPGGHAVYTQSPWGALFGSYSTDAVGEDVMKLDTVPEGSKRKPLKDYVSWNFLMLLYLPGLLVTTVLAIAFTVLPMLKVKLPRQVEKFIPWRMAIVALLSFFLTFVILLQSALGFGLQNGMTAMVDEQLKTEREKVKTPESETRYEINRGGALGTVNLRQTTANRLAIILHFVAVFGAAGMLLMTRRGDKPPPRVEVMW